LRFASNSFFLLSVAFLLEFPFLYLVPISQLVNGKGVSTWAAPKPLPFMLPRLSSLFLFLWKWRWHAFAIDPEAGSAKLHAKRCLLNGWLFAVWAFRGARVCHV